MEKYSSRSKQFQAYNDYKNLYFHSLINKNDWLQLKSLQGIVRTGKKLHFDVSIYDRKLSKSLHRKMKIKSLSKLEAVRWENGYLELIFNKKLSNNQLNYYNKFNTKEKIYQYIFNIHAFMLLKSQRLSRRGVSHIALFQYNSNRLHLIIENSSPLTIHFYKKSRKIIVKISNHTMKYTRLKHQHKIIVIDAGHGGKDPGATGYRGYREKNVVLAIGKDLRNILKARGYKVYMTRDSDYFVTLRHRTEFANKKHADIFISIHANAVKDDKKTTYGLETYYLSKARSNRAKRVAAIENRVDLLDMNYYGKESFLNTLNSHNIIASNKLAIDIQRNTLAALRQKYKYVKDEGVREAPFWVLVGTQMPAVLVETGFITNPREAKHLVNKEYQKTLAKGLADGIERYFINIRKSR